MPQNKNKLKTNTFKQKSEPDKGAVKPSKQKRNKTKRSYFLRDERFFKVVGISLIFIAFYLILAFVSFLYNWFNQLTDQIPHDLSLGRLLTDTHLEIYNVTGNVGAYLAENLLKIGFGLGAFYFPLLLFSWGTHLAMGVRVMRAWNLWKYAFISLIWVPLFFGFLLYAHPWNVLGGYVGQFLSDYLGSIIGQVGIVLALTFSLIVYLLLTFNLSIIWKKKSKSLQQSQRPVEPGDGDKYNTIEYAVKDEDDDFGSIGKGNNESMVIEDKAVKDEMNKTAAQTDNKKDDDEESTDIELSVEPTTIESAKTKGAIDRQTLDTEFDPTLDLPDFRFPPLDLLNMYGDGTVNVDREELEANKRRIVDTLSNYSIGIEKIKATIGPTVTLYEIIPSAGVRISRIKNLEDDIALSLSAIGIRIIAPIPGKGTVGIEVPNQRPELVSMRSIIGSERFTSNSFELPFGLGKTIANESYVADLTKMPHILMAGATGQGKSVGLNAIITSLLYCKHPAELKFVLVDPKKVELSLYSRIERHYLAKLPDSEEAIITDTRKVVRTLNSLSIEMDYRYELLKDAQVRNIKEYNSKFRARRLNPNNGHRFMPYIVLVVDEFADLIMTAGKEIESPITRLAQLARAVGIHLIIATQRPSVNIITGTIKANFPARIAFRVISRIDSRTILDSGGADQLVGRGDMLLSTGNDLIRLQCAFVDTPEVEKLTDFIGAQRGYSDTFHLPEYADEQDEIGDLPDPSERDELFEDAARIIVQHQQGSTSLLQRKLKLGYNRAGRIIDQLEAAGIVGPFEGSKAREVKVANEMALEQFLRDLDNR